MWLFGSDTRSRPQFKRKDQRFNSDLLTTPYGPVKNLSASGMCISCTGRPTIKLGQCLSVQLRTGRAALTVKGRVVWLRKQPRGFEAGFAFFNVSAQLAAVLQQLAQFGFVSSTFDSDDKPKPGTQHSSQSSSTVKPSASSSLNPYAILGIARNATEEQIRRAYRQLVRAYHPDANKAADAPDRFRQIVAAYQTLRREALKPAVLTPITPS